MIRIYTDATIQSLLVQARKDWTIQLADAVERTPVEKCNHRDGRDHDNCVKCVKRKTVEVAAALVRKIGGIQ